MCHRERRSERERLTLERGQREIHIAVDAQQTVFNRLRPMAPQRKKGNNLCKAANQRKDEKKDKREDKQAHKDIEQESYYAVHYMCIQRELNFHYVQLILYNIYTKIESFAVNTKVRLFLT